MELRTIADIETVSAAETEELGRLIGEALERGAFIALEGDLGGGKTTFTRGLARGLGIASNVTSPTFQLVREYEGRIGLFHFDFYRLETASELVDLDIGYCLGAGVVVAEWADRFPPPESDSLLRLRFDWAGESRRRIRLEACPRAAAALEKSDSLRLRLSAPPGGEQ